MKAAAPQACFVLPARHGQTLENFQADADGGYQGTAARIGGFGHRHCRRQDAGRRMRKAGVVIVEQMCQRAVDPGGRDGVRSEVRSHHARLGSAALVAHDVEDDASCRFRRRGECHAGAIQDMALGSRNRLAADVGELGRAGEFRKESCYVQVGTSCGGSCQRPFQGKFATRCFVARGIGSNIDGKSLVRTRSIVIPFESWKPQRIDFCTNQPSFGFAPRSLARQLAMACPQVIRSQRVCVS